MTSRRNITWREDVTQRLRDKPRLSRFNGIAGKIEAMYCNNSKRCKRAYMRKLEGVECQTMNRQFQANLIVNVFFSYLRKCF